MPIYPFLCDDEENGCGERFEKTFTFKEYDEKVERNRVTCPKCKKRSPVRLEPNIPELYMVGRTLGILADRKKSVDEQHHLTKKHTEYKTKQIDKPLPDGMTRGRDMV